MKLRITVEGRAYLVEVEVLDGEATMPASRPAAASLPPAAATASPPARPMEPSPPVAARRAPATSGGGEVKSPIAGTVLSVLVKPGQPVAVNETLIVLEAMKMETNVASPVAGTVAEVVVKPGDGVQSGQVLVRVG